MNPSKTLTNNIFDELLYTVESIGVEKTIKRLKEARTQKLITEDVNIDFILSAVIEVTGVTKERILQGKDRSDERKGAIGLFVYFLKKEFNFYSYADLKKILDKDESALYRYYNMIHTLPAKPKTEFDTTLTEYVKRIELLITEKKYK
jgi:hypothetical protein